MEHAARCLRRRSSPPGHGLLRSRGDFSAVTSDEKNAPFRETASVRSCRLVASSADSEGPLKTRLAVWLGVELLVAAAIGSMAHFESSAEARAFVDWYRNPIP